MRFKIFITYVRLVIGSLVIIWSLEFDCWNLIEDRGVAQPG